MQKRLKQLYWRALKAYAKGKLKKARRLEDEAMWLLFEIRAKEETHYERLQRDAT